MMQWQPRSRKLVVKKFQVKYEDFVNKYAPLPSSIETRSNMGESPFFMINHHHQSNLNRDLLQMIFASLDAERSVNLKRKFYCLQFSQKNELETANFCPSLLGQKFFVCFSGELKKQKSPFEIN